MSKLEPTRTSSDLTATDQLRRMLDERGVEYEVDDAKTVRVTRWGAYGDWVSFIEYDNGDTKFCIDARRLTPEQAIAATLGDVPRLPHFWTHDGTLHVELPKLPESISVRLPDQRDREVGSARVWQYTRDSGTCHECAGMDDVFECSACGGRYEGWALKRWARYCPDCGRRIEVDG